MLVIFVFIFICIYLDSWPIYKTHDLADMKVQ
jgi:hypothetical protein